MKSNVPSYFTCLVIWLVLFMGLETGLTFACMSFFSHSSGILKVTEVTSRMADTTEFAKSLSRLGFKLQKEACNSVWEMLNVL